MLNFYSLWLIVKYQLYLGRASIISRLFIHFAIVLNVLVIAVALLLFLVAGGLFIG